MSADLVAAYRDADVRQRELVVEVGRLAAVKRDVVGRMREAGMTFAEIGRLVGLSVSGVQRLTKGGS